MKCSDIAELRSFTEDQKESGLQEVFSLIAWRSRVQKVEDVDLQKVSAQGTTGE